MRVPQKEIFPLPDSVSYETGAALFVNYLTAYFSLFEIGNLKENQSILILSCTGKNKQFQTVTKINSAVFQGALVAPQFN